MPPPPSELTEPSPLNAAAADLGALRAELDRIDDALHDLLMERAGVVTRIGALGAKGRVALRPGREASIIRRLLARTAPPLPRQAVTRIWRELLSATTGMQGGHVIAVCDTDPACGYAQLAREHFGALTPARMHRTPAQALADLSSGAASVAVLPMPAEAEPAKDAWWTALLPRGDQHRFHVLARLPFWSPRPEGAPQVEALVVSAIAPDQSGRDRSLIALELSPELSRTRLTEQLTAAGLPPVGMIVRRDDYGGEARALIDVEGYVTEDDERLASLTGLARPPVVLGGYAVPEG